ncbi:NTP transferase domain-containing protein [Streptomyces sp. NPDC059788]|uniref:phosphocholine cytidylyltransferase family protein n=1 Tax=Streptomyces sp. NPDC059788 TaxID=3346948 RepID=UPI003665F8AA
MRAIVLAAGRGSRLRPFTADRPKCLVEIGGRTLLARQVDALRAAGARRVGVVAGWHAEAFASTGLPVFLNPDWERTTMAASLAAAESWLAQEPTLVSYGDIVYGPHTARALAASDAELAISYDPHWHALWSRRFADPLDDAETFVRDDAGRLLDIGGRAGRVEEIQGQYMGLLRMTPTAWAAIERARSADPAVAALDMTGLLRHVVRARLLEVATVPAVGPWCEFDHPSDIDVGLDVLRALDAETAEASETARGAGPTAGEPDQENGCVRTTGT